MLPRSNIPIGVTNTRMRPGGPGNENFVQYAASLGLLVKPSPVLVEHGAQYALGLFSIKHFKMGDLLTGMWGQYRTRLPRDKDNKRKLNYISVTNVPGP